MTINNTALYDAALGAIGDSNGAWLADPVSTDYAPMVSAAVAIATEIDSLIPTIVTGVTISQRDLLSSIVKNVMTGRSPMSTQVSAYSSITASIVAMYNEFASELINVEVAQGNSISGRKIQPNGSTTTDTSLNTNAATVIYTVNLNGAGLSPSTIYQAVVVARVVIYEDNTPQITGSMDLVSDMTIVANSTGNIFCQFNATQSPDLSRLVGTPLAGATLALTSIASPNGFSITVTRPSGISCHARCTWSANFFENIGIASDIPQQGTWGTGNYIDPNHGIGGSSSAVTSIASQEGTSVLTTSGGSFQIVHDSVTNSNALVGDGTAIMSEIDSSRWGGFGGTHTPFITLLQFTVPSAANGIILDIKDAGNTQRVTEPIFASPTTFAAYRVQNSNLILQVCNLTVGLRKTLVLVLHTDGNYYLIDESGTSAPVSDSTIGALTVDRILIGSNVLFHILANKLPATSNPLLEAEECCAQALVMP